MILCKMEVDSESVYHSLQNFKSFEVRIVRGEQDCKRLFFETKDYTPYNDHYNYNPEKHLAQNIKMTFVCQEFGGVL